MSASEQRQTADRRGPAVAVEALVGYIEDLRNRRKSAAERVRRPRRRGSGRARTPQAESQKTYSQDELSLRVWYDTHSYSNLLYGRTASPPPREVIMDIADYLECTDQERMKLLYLAGHRTQEPLLRGEQLRVALAEAERVLSYLPMPSIAITRDWFIRGWNGHALRLFDISNQDIEDVPPDHRHILHLIWNKQYAVHSRLTATPEEQLLTASQNIYWFKRSNFVCQDEPWYQRLVEDLCTNDNFRRLWESVEIDLGVQLDPQSNSTRFPRSHLAITRRDGRTLRIKALHMSLGNFGEYPALFCYLPYDEASECEFGRLGLATSGNSASWRSEATMLPLRPEDDDR